MAISPFDETPAPYNRTSVTGTMDTRGLDMFRQGVEITGDYERFSPVFFRFSTGEPGNAVAELNFGQVKGHALADSNLPHVDNERIVGSSRVGALSSNFTSPTPINEFLTYASFMSDGALDVFGVRSQIMGTSVDFPFPSRGFRGEFGNGNIDTRRMCDSIEQVTVATNKRSSNVDFFVDVDGLHDFEYNSIVPFDDASTEYLNTTIRVSSSTDTTMRAALFAMSGSTENMLQRHQIGTAAGFTFDDGNQFGVDSLAFAGFQSR